jgi:hypothetical protein
VQLGEKVMRSIRVVASTAVLVIGAACSDSGGSDAVASASTSSTTLDVPPEPSTTVPPPPLSTEAAAERYLAIVEPYNVALEALEQGVNGGQAVETLQAQAAGVAGANDTHRLELEATVWPAEVQPAVDELVAASVQAQAHWLAASQAPTRDTLITAVLAAGEHDGGAAAATIRSLLGVGDYSEEDYS